MMGIQEEMCRRAIELLLLPEDESCLLLDIGCGSGLSGSVLEDEGHTWIGIDISPAMLGKYYNEHNAKLNLHLSNLPFFMIFHQKLYAYVCKYFGFSLCRFLLRCGH